MKKAVSVVLVFVISLSLSGCSLARLVVGLLDGPEDTSIEYEVNPALHPLEIDEFYVYEGGKVVYTPDEMLKNMSEPEKWLHQNIYNTVQMLPGALATIATSGMMSPATASLPSASGTLSKGAIAGKAVKTIMDSGQNIGREKKYESGTQATNTALKKAGIDLAVSTLPGGEVLGTVTKTLLKKLLDDPQRYVVYNANNEAEWDNTKMLNDIVGSLQGKNVNDWLEYFLK